MYQYQVSFTEAIKRAFSKYCCFTGRASRSEFWWFYLFTQIVSYLLSIPLMITTFRSVAAGNIEGIAIASNMSFGLWLVNLWGLIVLLPSFGLLFRRLHDAGHSGWNWLWMFLPLAGPIIIIVFCCQESQPYDNKYGPEPNLVS